MHRLLACSLVAAAVMVAPGCGPGTPPSDGGPPGDAPRLRTATPGATMAACPPGSSRTYESFGRGFLDAYCTRCHSASRIGPDRNGAPADVNLDTHAGLLAASERVDRVAAAGPTRVNLFMPFSDPRPSDGERDALGEWLACGAP